ncbi:hypothetical protein QR680_003643 [Steinernema hermaphroditum]|uniref:Ku domain-containing protein n=1 Tax=Steinernema hermaphroditum TaxID=289476 RepID=A0AA39HM23_9BILA|nr:hypothetical protein QR680_003643 [Steinernema hermaphroditum]
MTSSYSDEYCHPSRIIQISNGRIRGKTYSFPELPKVDCFLGIPYGRLPIGELRFQKPRPVGNWNGIRDCSKFGPRAPQMDFMPSGPDQPPTSEDCLNLNVFVPCGDEFTLEDEKSGGRPVLVFIHGGGYAFHAASDYGDKGMCSTICKKGIIVVTVQYRLGFFGFLSTGDEVAPGNYGLWDQALALKWIHENIAYFGGNPMNVTVSGQSAGGASCDLLSLSPISRDLFQKVLPMGGNAECHFAMDEAENVRKACLTFAKKMGFEEDPNCKCVCDVPVIDTVSLHDQNKILVAFFRGLPAEELALGILGKPGFKINQKKLELVPVYDGAFLPKPLGELRREAPQKVCMIGATEYEGMFFVAMKRLKSGRKFIDQAIRRGIGLSDEENDEELNEVVDRIRRTYLIDDENSDTKVLEKAIIRIIGDSQISFSLPGYTSKMTASGHKVFLFSFDFARSGRLGFGNLMPFEAATHCSELPYIFGKGPFYEFHPDKEDKLVIDNFTTLIANFCRYGDPNGMEGGVWTPASKDNPYQYFTIDKECRMMEDYQDRTAEVWVNGIKAVKKIRRRKKSATSGQMEQLQVGGASGKKASIFALDCREAMFVPFEHESEQSTPFELAADVIWKSMSAIALAGNQNHYVSVLFFNTAKKSKETNAVDNVYNVVELAVLNPSIVSDFRSKYSGGDNIRERIESEFGIGTANLAELFFRFLKDITYGVGGKLQRNRCVVHLLSTMSDITEGYTDLLRKTAVIRKDLLGNGCRCATYLFGEGEPAPQWREIDADIDNMHDKLYELELDARYVTQEKSRRVIASVDFELAAGMSIALGIYGLYTKHPFPQSAKLDAETNEPIVTKTAYVEHDTGNEVAPVDVKMQQFVGGVDVALNKKDVEEFRRLCEPGIVLLGFKPLSTFKLQHCFNGSKFVFPQEKNIAGSSSLYKALLDECLEQQKYALVRYTMKRNTAPRLAALVPRKGQEGNPTVFEGFHLIDLPFSDDKRNLTGPMTKEDIVNDEPKAKHIDMAKAFIKKLSSSYSADSFSNPHLEKYYKYIEATALEQDMPTEDELTSHTKPWYANDNTKDRASAECEALCTALIPTSAPEHASVKRGANATGGGGPKKAKKTFDTKDEFIELAKELHAQNQMGHFTKQDLCNGANLVGMVYNKAMKKDQLIERLTEHLAL